MNGSSTDSDLYGQAALYLFGQLPAAEAKAFDDGADQAHRDALVEMTKVAASLALTASPVEPPPDLKLGVMERINRHPHPGLFSKRVQEQGPWKPSRTTPGISYKKLYFDKDSGLVTMLVKMEPGARFDAHTHRRTEQCLILEGELRYSDDKIYRAGDFTWAEAGSIDPALYTVEGNVLLIVSEP